MAEPNPVTPPAAPVNPKSFGEEDLPKSNAKTLEVPVGILNLDIAQSGYTHAEDYKLRLSLVIHSHLSVLTPIADLPWRLDFNPVIVGEINLAGKDAAVGAGGEIQWGLPPVAHIYLRNAALYLFDQTTFDWQMEGGLRLPTLFYEGPVQLGLGLAGGGLPLRSPNGYFSLNFNMTF